MTVDYHGNAVDIKYSVGDTGGPITLADGYSFEDIVIIRNPNTITPLFDNTKEQRFSFLIRKFGQIPDPNYFSKAFDPILVVGDDGNEYNVIPSDQFK